MIRIPTRGVVLWDLDFPNETRPIIAHRDPAGLEYEYEAIVEEPNEIQWYPKSNLAALNGKLYLLDDYVCKAFKASLNTPTTFDLIYPYPNPKPEDLDGSNWNMWIQSGMNQYEMESVLFKTGRYYPEIGDHDWYIWLPNYMLARIQRSVQAWITRQRQRKHVFSVLYTLLHKQGLDNEVCMRLVYAGYNKKTNSQRE